MPYGTRKVGKGKVRVFNKATGRVHAKASTPANAAAQERLLNAVDHGWEPTGKSPRELIHKGLETRKARKRRKST